MYTNFEIFSNFNHQKAHTHFADFEQVIIKISHFADFEQVIIKISFNFFFVVGFFVYFFTIYNNGKSNPV